MYSLGSLRQAEPWLVEAAPMCHCCLGYHLLLLPVVCPAHILPQVQAQCPLPQLAAPSSHTTTTTMPCPLWSRKEGQTVLASQRGGPPPHFPLQQLATRGTCPSPPLQNSRATTALFKAVGQGGFKECKWRMN